MVTCIYGASSEQIDEIYKDKCFSLGKKLAERGHSLIYGAGCSGLMGASARGFKAGGGYVHGVIPTFFKESKIECIFYEADKLTFTETMAQRKQIMEDGCSAFIVTPGGTGTFEEFIQVLSLKKLHRHDKPIAVFNINGFFDTFDKMLDELIQKKFLEEDGKTLYKLCSTEDEIIDYIENYKK